MHLIFRNVNGYSGEINKSEYLTLIPTNENKEKNKNIYKELWNKIRYSIRSIIKNSDDHDEKYMKMVFNSDDKLFLIKAIEILIITIALSAVFHEKKILSTRSFR